MEAYDKLKKLVSDGAISITYIDHLPRTISHALARCLYEIHDVEINEPFFTSKSNGTEQGFVGFEPACELILKEYQRVSAASPTKKPVTILVKDVAKSLPGRYWDEWLNVAENVITLVRDPHVQLYSLMEAIANDHVSPGVERVGRDDVLGRGQVIARALKINGTEALNTTSWDPIQRHLRGLERHLELHPHKSHVVIDGNLLLLEPQASIEALVSKLRHVNYHADMVSSWPKSRDGFPSDRDWGKSLVTTAHGRRNVWTNKAFGRDGFGAPSADQMGMSEFPIILQGHLKEIALPAYLAALRHPSRLGPKNYAGMAECLDMPVGKDHLPFHRVNPTSAYALMATITVPSQQFTDTAKKKAYLDRLRSENPQHATTFDCIDQLERPKTGRSAVEKGVCR